MSGVRMKTSQDYKSLQQELLKARALFADPQFPPQMTSIYPSGRMTSDRFPGAIVWKRPKDLCNNPVFMYHGATRQDLDQGYLGNCWFIAGAALLATGHKQLFERVLPSDQGFEEGRYTGMFRFNFWWYGKWIEIIIDDYLPTDGRNLIFCSNRERTNEFWPSLLEKAYAKLHGSYEGLDGGQIQDAMVDLSGGISEVVNIMEKEKIESDLFSLLSKSHSMKSMIGACIFKPTHSSHKAEILKKNGLYMGHAYSITGMHQIPSGRGVVNLMRVRNPWGKGEWQGPWSDNSPEMSRLSSELRDELRYSRKDDGEFWMSYDDFIFEYDQIQLCHLQPDSFLSEISQDEADGRPLKQMWNVTVYHDAWIRGVTAGGCGNAPNEHLYWKNPQFFVTLDSPDNVLGKGHDCTLIVSLMEKEINSQVTNKVAVGFDVYKLKNNQGKPLNASRAPRDALLLTRRSGQYVFYREVTKRFELDPGSYVIIPSTFHPHEEADFLIRIFTEKRVDSGILDEQVDPKPIIPSPKDLVEDIFRKRAGNDKQMDAAELRSFLEEISGAELKRSIIFSLEACRSLVTLMDENRSGFLSFEEVRRAWKEVKAYREVFKHFDADGSDMIDTYELATVFSKLGFPVNKGLLTAIVRRYGNRDNLISLADFITVICKLTALYAAFHQQQRKNGQSQDSAEFTRNEFLQTAIYM